ncbi:MAG: ATPase P [Clostridia bacterium]|nr:ATPase P [Clostridia bacterium]
MIFKPHPLSATTLTDVELTADKKRCQKIGPCGVGEKAIYLNSFYIERRYYVPFDAVRRIYKRVAMSKGGFSGKGIFASIPYLVVEYDDGSEKQCNFKFEEKVDQLLAYVGKAHPEIPLHSKAAEKKLREKARKLAEKKARLQSAAASEQIQQLESCAAWLEREPELSAEMSAAARAKRTYDRSNPAYKWVALAITLAGLAALIYGVYALIAHQGFAIYFLLFGLAAIFFFSSASVLPTAKNNRKAIDARLAAAEAAVERHVQGYSGFPVPARYAHPIVLRRMIDILAENRAPSVPASLEQLKIDLKRLNANVTVDQDEYDEIMAIKPLFLIHDYQ